ncbi:MAG: type IV toxin-antitoxin system AbiEi family antitoxin domain-containing protein [Polyangiales bacterium]
MPRYAAHGRVPDRRALYDLAAAQAGYFAAPQAAEAGYSLQLLQYHVRTGDFERWGRGIFRLVSFPPSDHEELVPVWLWSGRVGVFGLDTALALHGLSDALPSKLHLLLPVAWSKRRLKVPTGTLLTFADVPDEQRAWLGPVPVTTPLRTVRDCIEHHVSPELVEQAIADGVRRRLFTRADVRRRQSAA